MSSRKENMRPSLRKPSRKTAERPRLGTNRKSIQLAKYRKDKPIRSPRKRKIEMMRQG